MDSDDLQTSGWEAIDSALAPLYGSQTPKHYGTLIGYELGGPDPIRGISAYKRIDPVPHWHFITYGFSELYDKESDNKDVSGWGFELTMRLKTEPDSEEPPSWTLNFLQNLARYVFNSGNVFSNGDYLNANGAIAAGSESLIRAVAFIHDPELPAIETPNGDVEFLQVVGVTDDEELAIKQWNALEVLEVFRDHLPLLLTDLERKSLLERPDVREKLAAGAATNGSKTGNVFVEGLDWNEKKRLLRKSVLDVVLGARQVREILGLLPYRLPFERELALIGTENNVVFAPATDNGYTISGNELRLAIHPDALAELLSVLKPQEGIYHLRTFRNVALQVRKTHIKDGNGKVVKAIG